MLRLQTLLISLMSTVLIVAGCVKDEVNQDESNLGQSAQEKNVTTEDAEQRSDSNNITNESAEWKNAPPLPTTIEEFILYPVGQFAGVEDIEKNDQAKAFFSEIPKLSEDASDEDVEKYFTYIYSLLKPDYTDPNQIVADYSQVPLPDGLVTVPAELQKETFNVEIVLDSSGSMANKMDGKTRMKLAKEAIKEFMSSLPKEANVGLRVYGHKGTGSDKDKEMSCSSNELVYRVQPYHSSELDQALGKFQPAGWTPLAKAIELASQDLAKFSGDKNHNIIFIVSDGMETCGGDPVNAAALLKNSHIKPVVNIVGFDLDKNGQAQLKAVAEAAGGTFVDVKDQQQLRDQFEQKKEEARKWLSWYYKSRSKALEARGDHFDQIMSWRKSYNQKMHACFAGLLNSISYLVRNDKITGDQREKMLDIYGELRNREIDIYEQTSNKLFDLKDLKFEEAVQKIEAIFQTNRRNGS